MAKTITTQVTLRFDDGLAEPSLSGETTEPIVLENWVYDLPEGSYAIKMYPSVDAKLYASEGTVQYHTEDEEDVPADFITVNGETEFSRPKDVGYEVVFSILHPDSAIPLRLVEEPGGLKVSANQRFWGLVRVEGYKRKYRILDYRPTPEKKDLSYTAFDPLGNLRINLYGTVAAFYKDQVGTLFVIPQNGTEDVKGDDEIEIYRITSKAVVNDQGEWEYPPGWPTDTSYPTGATPEPEPEIGIVTERVHEIGYVNRGGNVWTRTQNISKATPFASTPGYVPVKTITDVSLPEDLPAFAKAKAVEALARRKKGVL
jgi:hypothetical protein